MIEEKCWTAWLGTLSSAHFRFRVPPGDRAPHSELFAIHYYTSSGSRKHVILFKSEVTTS
jgi:hypothetical protein